MDGRGVRACRPQRGDQVPAARQRGGRVYSCKFRKRKYIFVKNKNKKIKNHVESPWPAEAVLFSTGPMGRLSSLRFIGGDGHGCLQKKKTNAAWHLVNKVASFREASSARARRHGHLRVVVGTSSCRRSRAQGNKGAVSASESHLFCRLSRDIRSPPKADDIAD